MSSMARKMVRQHPHLFGDAKREMFLATDMWGRIKEAEKAERGGVNARSRFGDVPLALPALTRAVKLQKRAAKVGFDWPSVSPVFDKAEEELDELKAAVGAPDETADASAKRASQELGDLLFAIANIARHLGVDPEAALAMRTRNLYAASNASKTLWPRMGGNPKTRPSKRWVGSGTRPRPASRRRRSIRRRA